MEKLMKDAKEYEESKDDRMKPVYGHFPDTSGENSHYIYAQSRPLSGYYYYGSDQIYRPTYEDPFS